MSEKFLRLPEVRQATGLGRSTLYRMIEAGKFPRPIKILGPGKAMPVAFLKSEVENWQRERIAAGRGELRAA